MRSIALVFLPLAFVAHGRRVPVLSDKFQNAQPVQRPGVNPSSAFNPSGLGAWLPTQKPALADLRPMKMPHSRIGSHWENARAANSAPVMQDGVETRPDESTSTEEVEGATPPPGNKFDARDMAGVSEPLGFFDPWGMTEKETEGKIRFYREVELKHGRVAMLAALGFLVAEQFHPLFGGNIDALSIYAFQQTPLQTFWPAVVLAIAIPEVFSIFTFESPSKETWAIKSDHEPGNLGFDPLGLKPTDPKELKIMQTKELNNGRLAMIAIAGMIYQEAVTRQKLF